MTDFIKQAQEMIHRFELDEYLYTGKRYMGGGQKMKPTTVGKATDSAHSTKER